MALNETPLIGNSIYNAAVASNMMLGDVQAQQRTRRLFTPPQEEPAMAPAPPTNARRLVQVFIVDPDPNVPVDQCLLYQGKLHLTDLTDQELFFEIGIQGILVEHNKKRVEITDKSVRERTQKLEPARIRDLRMQIVNVATF